MGKRNICRMGTAIVISYLCLVAFMYATQRNHVYFPYKAAPDPEKFRALYFNPVEVRTADGLMLHGWFRPVSGDGDRPVIVMFHGNGGSIEHRLFKAEPFVRAGYGFLLAEYRGYGGNPGKPTEQGLYSDARAWLALLKDMGVDPSRIVLYGESLGTGVAVQLAAETGGCKAVVLEAPFTSLASVGQANMPWLPVVLLMKDRFDNKDRIGKIRAPLLVVHGDSDRIVPYRFGKGLFDLADEPKRMETIKGGGHNDLYDFDTPGRIMKFLEALDKG